MDLVAESAINKIVAARLGISEKTWNPIAQK